MDNIRVLFICGHNSGRSQMAEVFLNDIAGDRMHVESAGLEPKPINLMVVEVMQEIGYDRARSPLVGTCEGIKLTRKCKIFKHFPPSSFIECAQLNHCFYCLF